jgi:predicted heme/steroid binding protein
MKPWTTRMLWTAILVIATVALFGLVGCGGSSQVSQSATTVSAEPGTTGTTGPTFTLDELAQFDGQNGAPAYVAVDGLVYDVTGSILWPDGKHARCDLGAMAGKDLSEIITQAPANMRSNLARMTVVGTLSP